MGVCRSCKTRSQLFCYNHRVTVCSNCITEHPTCAIGLYTQWVKSESFDVPACPVCTETITSEYNTVRLHCLHIIHINCLDRYGNQQPANTALAGYICPHDKCGKQIIPSQKTDTLLYKNLENVLLDQNWSKQFLSANNQHPDVLDSPHISNNSSIEQRNQPPSPSSPSANYVYNQQESSSSYPTFTVSPVSRKASKLGSKSEFDVDSDEEKYRRRGVMQLLLALGIVTPGYGGHVLNSKRLLLSFLLISLLLLFWVVVKSDFNQSDATTNP